MSLRRRVRSSASVMAVTMLVLSSMAGAQTQVKPGMNWFTIQQDIQLGRQASEQVERQMPMIYDETVQEWIDQLGRHLAASTTMPDLPWRFRVANSSQINAFALPGGFVYVNRGLIEMTDSESEVAGAMAHEMAHVTLRHGTNQLSKMIAFQVPLAMVGAGGLGQMGLSMAFLKFSRTDETQADIVGTQTMVKAGFDPQGMVRIFEKLKKISAGRATPEFLSDHPDPGDRLKRIEKEITYLKVPPNPIQSLQSYFDARERLRDMPPAPAASPRATSYPGGGGSRNPTSQPGGYPPSSQPGGYPPSGGGYPPSSQPGGYPPSGGGYPPSSQPGGYPPSGGGYPPSSQPGGYPPSSQPGGYPPSSQPNYPSSQPRYPTARSGEPPSATFETFRSADGLFQVGYPSNWQAYSDTGKGVTLAPDSGLEGSEVTRGALVGYFDLSSQGKGAIGLDQALDTMIGQLSQSNSYLKEERDARYSGTLAGGEALATYLSGTNNGGKPERNWLIVRPSGSGILYMLFVAPDREFGRLEPTFQSMILSFRLGDRNYQSAPAGSPADTSQSNDRD
jgi:Zn-dependent protease with chaperone function